MFVSNHDFKPKTKRPRPWRAAQRRADARVVAARTAPLAFTAAGVDWLASVYEAMPRKGGCSRILTPAQAVTFLEQHDPGAGAAAIPVPPRPLSLAERCGMSLHRPDSGLGATAAWRPGAQWNDTPALTVVGHSFHTGLRTGDRQGDDH